MLRIVASEDVAPGDRRRVYRALKNVASNRPLFNARLFVLRSLLVSYP